MWLRLSDKYTIWALVHPTAKFYIGGQLNSGTYSSLSSQDVQLTLTEEDPGPVKVDLTGYPDWAQKQIKSGLVFGQIIEVQKEPEIAKMVVESSGEFGLLGLPVATIKEKAKQLKIGSLLELLVKEKEGLNNTGKPRSGLITFLEGEIQSQT